MSKFETNTIEKVNGNIVFKLQDVLDKQKDGPLVHFASNLIVNKRS